MGEKNSILRETNMIGHTIITQPRDGKVVKTRGTTTRTRGILGTIGILEDLAMIMIDDKVETCVKAVMNTYNL